MKIGIVGCGWLGEPLAYSLLEKEYTIHGTSRDIHKIQTLEKKGIIMHHLDLSYEHFDRDWLRHIDLIILNVPPSQLKEAYTERNLAICSELPLDAKAIFISSTSVYSDDLEIADENSPTLNQQGNAPFIIETERQLRNLLKDRLTIIRFAGLVGENRHPVKYMSGKSYCSGNSPVNLIHQADCIGMIEKVILTDKFGETFNGCCSAHPTKADYYTAAAQALQILPPSFTNSTRVSKIISSIKMKDVLGYHLRYPSPFNFPEVSISNA